jgi:RNA polymerase sigma-70 factor (family 1)
MNMPLLSDEELLHLTRSGEGAAFTEIYHRYWKKLLTVAINKTGGNIEEAEEIVQDIFVSLWSRREKLELTSSLEHYLAASVKYQIIKSLAKKDLLRRYTVHNQSTASGSDNSTQDWLDFEELQSRLEALVAALPEKCQLVYRMSRESGYSQKKIAGELSISEKTVEAHLGKALKSLRDGLYSLKITLFPLRLTNRLARIGYHFFIASPPIHYYVTLLSHH